MKTILDTDFLINVIKNKINIEEIRNPSIIDKTIDELKKINNSNSKMAIKLIKLKKFKTIKTKKDKIVDDLILENIKKGDLVATQDKNLKKELKGKQIKVITIRQKKYINPNI
jgi:rRNA-processing protein FCF1|tara:strand:- start:1968 stop:2306 length:339 start_codon:yes stop_codon:yes gene_type:complete